ncbi:MAG: RDD family protein [Kofleriaceae bacterium]|nr:RDD family protein [Kofleriaceae bacterium]MCL4227493.1 RDD family protein [Myxococcales bacterium]
MSDGEPATLGLLAASETGDAGGERRGDDPGDRARAQPAAARPAPRSRSAGMTVHVAGFWRRAGGAAIDAGVILPVSLVLTWLTSALAGIRLPAGKQGELDFWLDLVLTSDPAVTTAVVITLAVTSIYLFVFQATIAQTLGMRVMKLRVIDGYGDPPSYPRAGLRTAGYLASLATLLLGFLWIGFDAEKRGLHDWIAGTYVIRA